MSLRTVMEYVVLNNNLKDGFEVLNYASGKQETISYEEMYYFLEESIHHILNIDISKAYKSNLNQTIDKDKIRELQPLVDEILFYKDIYFVDTHLVINREDIIIPIWTVSSLMKIGSYVYLFSATDELVGRINIADRRQNEAEFEIHEDANCWTYLVDELLNIWNECFYIKESQSFYKTSTVQTLKDSMLMDLELMDLDYKVYYLENKYTKSTVVSKAPHYHKDNNTAINLVHVTDIYRQLLSIQEGYVQTSLIPSKETLKMHLPQYKLVPFATEIINTVLEQVEYIVGKTETGINVKVLLAELFTDAVNQDKKIKEITTHLCHISNFAHIIVRVRYDEDTDTFRLWLQTIGYKRGEKFQEFCEYPTPLEIHDKKIEVNVWEVYENE